MTPPPWGIAVLMVVGIAVIVLGALWDRHRLRREAQRLRLPPEHHIPGLAASEHPDYVTEDDLDAVAASAATPASAAILDLRDGAPTLPAGVPNSDFLTDPNLRLATVANPSVLVTDADVSSQRDVLTALGAARRRGRSLVWVARSFAPDALGSLRANTATGRITVLPIAVADADADDLSQAAILTGGRLLDASDLAADWLPDEAWGTCAAWIADLDQSWIIPRTPTPER